MTVPYLNLARFLWQHRGERNGGIQRGWMRGHQPVRKVLHRPRKEVRIVWMRVKEVGRSGWVGDIFRNENCQGLVMHWIWD